MNLAIFRSALISMGVLPMRPTLTMGNRVVLVGDSITLHNYATYRIGSLVRASGVVTMTLLDTPYYMFPGCPVNVLNAAETGIFRITEGAGLAWKYNSPGPDGPIALNSNPVVANMSTYADNGWFTWANILSNRRFELVGMSAATGRTTAEMLARIGEVTALDADLAMVLASINDILGSVPVSTIISNLQGIYERLLRSGKMVCALTVLPLAAPAYTNNPNATAVILEVNAWIRQYCATKRGMYCIDTYAAMVDPLSASKGSAKANMLRSNDGVHTTQRGGHLLGKCVAAGTAFIPSLDRRVSCNADTRTVSARSWNVWDYAPFTNTVGTVSGGATGAPGQGFDGGVNAGAAVAWSLAARADGVGFDNVAVIQPAANDSGTTLQSGNIPLDRLPVGVTIQADVSVSVTNAVNGKFKTLQHFLQMQIGGVLATLNGLFSSGSTGLDCVQEDWSGVVSTPPLTLTVAPTAAFMRTVCNGHAQGTDLGLRAGRYQVQARAA